MMINIKNDWQKLATSQQKTLKILSIISLALIIFYWGKTLIVQHFIHQFLKKPPVIGLSHAQVKPWRQYYHTIGQLKAIQSTNLSVQTPGIIHQIWVKPGQWVKKNQKILELKAAVEKANLKVQRAEYSLQQQLFQQQTELFKKNIISKTQYLEAKTRLKKAHALYQEAKAQVARKAIRAPFSGIVGIPEVHKGDYINPGQTSLLTLQQSKKLYLDFYIPEQYYANIQKNNHVLFSLENQKTKLFRANIIGIQPASQQMAHTIWVRALVDNHQGTWIPGLSVHIKVQTTFKPKTILVPNPCVLGSVKGPIVYTAKRKLNPQTQDLEWWIEQKRVKIGLAQKHYTEIIAGLNGQEYIVSSGTQKVHDKSFAILKKTEAI